MLAGCHSIQSAVVEAGEVSTFVATRNIATMTLSTTLLGVVNALAIAIICTIDTATRIIGICNKECECLGHLRMQLTAFLPPILGTLII